VHFSLNSVVQSTSMVWAPTLAPARKPATMNPLDNPIWTALTTRHADLSEGDEIARRYLPSYTTLAGMAEETDAAFASLARITTRAQRIGICSKSDFAIPSTWICSAKFPVSQMICAELKECKTFPMEILTDDDVPEMRAGDVDSARSIL
jgi:hypothetical protein